MEILKYIFYIIFDVIYAIIIYFLMKVIVNYEKVYNRKIELISYFIYILFCSFIYLIMKNPLLIISINILALFFLFLNYKLSTTNRIILSITIYFLFLVLEVIFTIINKKISFYNFDIHGINILEVLLRVLFYSAILIFILKFEILKLNVALPLKFWLPFFTMPLISIMSSIYFFRLKVFEIKEILIYLFIILFFNLNMFYLYTIVYNSMKNKLEINFLLEKNNLYNKQLDIMSKALEINKNFRHDLKNHLILIKNTINSNNSKEALEYIEKVFNIGDLGKDYIKINNFVIESILNFKLQELYKSNIKFQHNIIVPEELNIEKFDLVIIIGNILDNAIEANLNELEIEKFINLKINFDKNRLFITLINSFDGILKYNNNKIITKKLNKEGMNGIGLKNVEIVVEKYNGLMKIETNKNIFELNIILFIKNN